MSKPIKAWIKYAVTCAVIMCASLSAQARRFIYYFGSYNEFPVPIEKNEAQFEDFKLYETADGSNIYEGILSSNTSSLSTIHYFNFYTKLTSDEAYDNGQDAYRSNRILPTSDYNRDNADEFKPGYIFEFNNPPYYEGYPSSGESWQILLPYANASIKFTVDLNNKTVMASTDATVLVINDNVKPSIENLDEYSFNGKQVYVPAGECHFRAYNFFKDKFYTLPNPTEVTDRTVYLDTESNAFCNIPNWGGGTIVYDGVKTNKVTINNNYQSLNETNSLENWGTTAYLVGNFTGWSFSDEFRMRYDNGIFYGVKPANSGKCQFKITDEKNWNSFSVGAKRKTTVGNTTFFEVGNYNETDSNIELDINDELNISFEPARKAVKIWPASQNAPDPEPDGFFYDNRVTPDIPKFTGIVLDQKGMFVDLTKVAPSKVGISNLTTIKTPEADEYQFTIDVCVNKPFRFLQFIEDELVAIYQPVNDVNLYWVGDFAHGHVNKVSKNDAPTYWTSKEDGETTVTIKPNSKDLNGITFRMPSLIEPSLIYMIGSMNDWNMNDAYANYQLKETADGKYYGSFNIPKGQVELKFLKDLNGWAGITPIGAPYADCPTFSGSTLLLPITSTQYNCPSISFNWEGGMIYMLVTDSEVGEGILLLSREPLDVTYLDEGFVPQDDIYIINGNTGEKYSGGKIGEGLFQTTLTTNYNNPKAPYRLKILRAKHTFADTEPEFLNSYTLTFAETQLTVGDDGIAETSFIYNDGVNVGGGNEIEIYPSGYYHSTMVDYVVLVDLNKNKIYFDNRIGNYVLVDDSNNKMPTYDTRNEFADNFVKNSSSGIILNLPKGDVTLKYVYLYSLTYGYNGTDEAEATFNNEGVAKTDFWSLLTCPEIIKLHNCPGGEFFVTMHRSANNTSSYNGNYNFHFIALDKIKTFDAVTEKWNQETQKYDYNSIGQLTLTDPATKTYSGRIDVPAPETEGGYSYISFIINNDVDFGFGGSADRLIIDDATKTANYNIDLKNLYQYISFANAIAPTVDITLSLETMKAEVKLVDGETANAFTINTSAGEITLPPTANDDGFSATSTVDSDEDGNISLNITGTNGNIIVPANGDTEMIFDADGVFTDDIAVIKTPSTAVRRAPLVAGKWYYSAGEGRTSDNLGISFDLVNKTATFVSQNHAASLYAVAAAENEKITDVERVKNGVLTPNGDGAFSGKVHVAAGEKLYIVRRANGAYVNNGMGYGLVPQATNVRSIDTEANVVDIPVIPSDMQLSYGWTLENNPGCDVKVTYNPEMMLLHLEMDTAGVEDVAVDDTYDNAEPVYYNLQGVRITNPESGHIYIEIRGAKARKIVK